MTATSNPSPVAVVTGAGRGIGAAVADRLTVDGFTVHRLDVAASDAPTQSAEIIPCDIADHAAVSAVADRVGPVDVLVNNAGIWTFGPLETVTPADFQRVIDVNLVGTFNCTQAFGRSMLDRGGSIVNIVSIAAAAANPAVGAYSSSKAGVLALTRQTALEWGPRGVRANAVGPGFVPTPGTGGVYDDEAIAAERADRIPLKRLGQASDVAEAVSYLASSRASYITGQVIYVDGGVSQSLMNQIARPHGIPGPHIPVDPTTP